MTCAAMTLETVTVRLTASVMMTAYVLTVDAFGIIASFWVTVIDNSALSLNAARITAHAVIGMREE